MARQPAHRSRVCCKVWVEREGEVILSDWRVALLEAVASEGSLAGAADSLGVPYRTAWQRLKEIETRLGVQLLETESGGAAGGASRLTPAAEALVAGFRRVTAGVLDRVEDRFAAELAGMLE